MYHAGGRRRLRVAAAGTMCTPWSKVGERTGWCHKDVLSHYSWLADVFLLNKYDMVHLEQSDRFPIGTHVEFVKTTGLSTAWIVLRPSLLGWPTHGARLFATSYTSRLVCLAPEDESIILHITYYTITHYTIFLISCIRLYD